MYYRQIVRRTFPNSSVENCITCTKSGRIFEENEEFEEGEELEELEELEDFEESEEEIDDDLSE